MTATRASVIALAASLAFVTLTAEGCPKPQPPLVKQSGSSCSSSQKGKAAVDESGRELICTYSRRLGGYYWLVPDNN